VAVTFASVSLVTGGAATLGDCYNGHTTDCALGIASAGFGSTGPAAGFAAGAAEDAAQAADWVGQLAASVIDWSVSLSGH
jgi:hypothetical protein